MSYVFFGSAEAESMAARNAEYVASVKDFIRSFIGRLTETANVKLLDTLITNGVHFDFTESGLIVSIPVYDILTSRVIPLAKKIILTAGFDVIGLHGIQDVPVRINCYPSEYGIALEKAMMLVADLASLGTSESQASAVGEANVDDLLVTTELLHAGKNFFILPPADTTDVGHYGCVITDGKNGFAIPDVFGKSGIRILPLSKVNLSTIKADTLTVQPPVMLAIKGAVSRAFSQLCTFAKDFHNGDCEAHAYHYTNQDTAVALVSRKSKLALQAPQFYKDCEDIELTTQQHVAIAERVWHQVDLPALEEVAANMVDRYLQRVIDSYRQVFSKQEKKNGKN